MARITVEDCLEKVGDDNRFALIHLAVERIRQHRKGEPFLVAGKDKEIGPTLLHCGKQGFELLGIEPFCFDGCFQAGPVAHILC